MHATGAFTDWVGSPRLCQALKKAEEVLAEKTGNAQAQTGPRAVAKIKQARSLVQASVYKAMFLQAPELWAGCVVGCKSACALSQLEQSLLLNPAMLVDEHSY